MSTENPKIAKQSAERRQDTACFVHSLLEKKRKSRYQKDANLQAIKEDTRGDQGPGVNDDKATHSRLLTKRQLSDMAWGVRELSKRLGSVRLKLQVRTVFLLTKAHDEELIQYTIEVVEWLLSQERKTSYVVYVRWNQGSEDIRLMRCSYVEDTLEHNHTFDAKSIVAKDASREGRLKYWNNDLCRKHPSTFDFVVTV